MSDGLVNLFDSPRGVNNVDDPKSSAFQPPTREKPEPPFLTVAENVDATRTGSLVRRRGRIKRRVLSDGHSLVSSALGLFYADGGTLYRYEHDATSDPVVATGLDPRAEISYAALADALVWSNGAQSGRITAAGSAPWGIERADPPTLSRIDGSLPAGGYQVAVAPLVGALEGGCAPALLVLDAPGGILAEPNGIDPRADALAVYLSDPNGQELFFHSIQPVGVITLTGLADSLATCEGLGVHPPPPGHLVRVWGGFVLVARSDPADGTHALYASEPGAPHRFRLDIDVQLFPSRIVLLEPTVDGVYVALESGGTFWISGNDPQEWSIRQIDDRQVAEGSAVRVPAAKLPWLRLDAETLVPVWATRDGLAAGLPGGMVRYPQDGQLALDANARATLSYVERPGLRQLLLAARDKRMESRIGFGDQMSISVTRGGRPL